MTFCCCFLQLSKLHPVQGNWLQKSFPVAGPLIVINVPILSRSLQLLVAFQIHH